MPKKKYPDGSTYKDSSGRTRKRVSAPGTKRGNSMGRFPERQTTVAGMTFPSLAQACRHFGVEYFKTKKRLHAGWTPEEAFDVVPRAPTAPKKLKLEQWLEEQKTGKRKCKECGELKPLEAFTKHKKCVGGYAPRCRVCKTSYSRLKRYGVDQKSYHEMLAAQGNKCAICGTKDPATHRTKHTPEPAFCVDHCHKTGRVRGLLCGYCNTGIGKLRDNPDIMRRAAQYVESNL